MADLGLVQHHEFSMSYLCTHGGGLRRELESGESTVNAFFPKLINKLGVILWFNGFLRIMRWQTKSLHNLGSCMNLSVAWMRSARCTIDHWRFSGIQSISDCKVWTKAAEKKSKLSWQRVGKLLCRGSYFHDQNPAPLGMVHNLSHTSLWGFSVAPRNEAKQIFW